MVDVVREHGTERLARVVGAEQRHLHVRMLVEERRHELRLMGGQVVEDQRLAVDESTLFDMGRN